MYTHVPNGIHVGYVKKYPSLFCGIVLVRQKIVMDMNNVMLWSFFLPR